jgi:small subunit ribosomal protein S6
MRTYETIFIVHPDIVGDSYNALMEKFKTILTDQKAEILKVDEWGSRKLAYPIKKLTRGTFVLVAYNAESTVIAEFERRMRIDENIIKFQTVHLEKGLESVPAPREAAETGSEEASETSDEETETAE